MISYIHIHLIPLFCYKSQHYDNRVSFFLSLTRKTTHESKHYSVVYRNCRLMEHLSYEPSCGDICHSRKKSIYFSVAFSPLNGAVNWISFAQVMSALKYEKTLLTYIQEFKLLFSSSVRAYGRWMRFLKKKMRCNCEQTCKIANEPGHTRCSSSLKQK